MGFGSEGFDKVLLVAGSVESLTPANGGVAKAHVKVSCESLIVLFLRGPLTYHVSRGS